MTTPPSILRPIRSFVKRDGRFTAAQKKALQEAWPLWGIDFDPLSPVLVKDEFFSQDKKRYLDIGFGNGETLYQMAELNLDKQFIGIEVHRPGIANLCRMLQQQTLDNLRVINHDAVQVMQSGVFDFKFDGIYLLFADPWPKTKHHKRRIVQAEFIQLLGTLLKPNGYFYVATDWDDYAIHVQKVMRTQTQFTLETSFSSRQESDPLKTMHSRAKHRNEGSDQGGRSSQMATDVIPRPHSKYERRGHKLGHAIHDMLYRLSE